MKITCLHCGIKIQLVVNCNSYVLTQKQSLRSVLFGRALNTAASKSIHLLQSHEMRVFLSMNRIFMQIFISSQFFLKGNYDITVTKYVNLRVKTKS